MFNGVLDDTRYQGEEVLAYHNYFLNQEKRSLFLLVKTIFLTASLLPHGQPWAILKGTASLTRW